MKFAASFLALVGSAAAFAPAPSARSSTSLGVYNSVEEMPGALPPVGIFDPLGLAKNANSAVLGRYREAELQHGRVAMLAAVGMLITEEPIEYHPLFESWNKDIGPAIRHLDEVRAVSPLFFELFAVVVGSLELNRAIKGWKEPETDVSSYFELKDGYTPGDIGFDPLGLRPEDPEALLALQNKELQNGRLAMLGASGMIAQELVNGKEIFVNLGWAADRFDPSTLPVQF